MFKRANKITSLLVAAAAVASMVPAYAADVKKVDSQDGTVYNAVAYKDGTFYVDGEVNDKDEATYYVANGKYTNLSDIDAGADVTTYGTKYVEVQGGDYYVDLTSGKVTDDSIADDARDDAASNLRKKVKADTDGRYLKDGSANAADTLKTFTSSDEISGGAEFGDVWYATRLANKDATNGLGANSGALNVFTDGSGNYIDADYNLGKIKVTTTGKSVYVENTDDTYDTADSNVKIVAKVVASTEGVNGVIGQDKDYIYRKATVTVQTTAASASVSAAKVKAVNITEIGGKSVNAGAFKNEDTATTNGYSFEVIQKISKAQSSDEIGGVKYAKTVNTYVISDSDAKSKTFKYKKYAIADGKVIGYNNNTTTVDIQTATLKSEDGLYYTDLGSASTGDDIESVDSIQVDASGNVWRLKDGYLYQWNNDEDWDKVYKVDGSFNKFSVYDKNNIVAWNQDDEAYSVIGGKTTTKDTKDTDTTGAATGTTTTAAAGWVKNTDGTWSYNKAGVKATGWLQDGATWYYLNTNGIMQTGWQNVGGTWYFLNASGAMQTGWINDGGTWYYCNASGAMLANTVVDGYVLGASGAWVK